MEERETNYGGETEGGGYEPPTRSRGVDPDPAGQPTKKSRKRPPSKTAWIVGGLSAVVVISAAVAVAGGGKNGTTDQAGADSSYSNIPIYPQPTDPDPATNANVDVVTVTTAAAGPAQVVYACTGSAPDGVDITYGPSGSDYSASKLPFTHTDSYDASAQFYVTEAQLSGSGEVTCTTTVEPGDGTQTVNTGTAQGGYNIASAQVCSTFDGSWDKC